MERPLEIRQLDALKDWLGEGWWDAREAACILVGVLPRERSGDSDRPFGAWLPGCEPWEEGRDSWANWIAGEIGNIEAMLRANAGRLEGVKPENFLSFALRHDISPPWLPAALAGADYRAFLPAEAFVGQSIPGGPLTQREASSKGGNAKREKDPQRAKFFPIVRAMVVKGMTGADINRSLDDKYSDAPGDSTVYGWIKQIKDEAKTG